ncbi:hypothetical protein [Fluviicola sp.]|uniref:hypothetical protein n=1 Tax=Fluviicola sp. TaxID=1917219 RepID=UPI0031D39D1A
MNQIITIIFAGFTILATAQTHLIAHKSHSGSSAGFFIDPNSNFGERIDFNIDTASFYKTKNFIPLNDTLMILRKTDYRKNTIQTDTLLNNQKLSPLAFELRYMDSIRKKELEAEYKRQLEEQEQVQKQQLESRQKLNETTPTKKKKKSYLLFLFGITGGGMLLLRLFRKSTDPKTSIA